MIKRKLIAVLLMATACQSRQEIALDPIAYQAEIENWHANRIADLKGESGWLNLAGLFWLREGINTFGSDSSNDIVFPEAAIGPKAGFFLVKNGTVHLHVNPEVEILLRDEKITEALVFHPDSTRQPVLTHGSLKWFIIKRDNQLGVRLRDLKSTAVENFTGIERYEVDLQWRVRAHQEIPLEPKTIPITNVLGQTTEQKSPGTLVFNLENKEYRLDALEEGDKLFIIFGDSTNASETYPAGRYLYAQTPGPDGITILDFNQAYNPPCAFTPFATCPLPPAQNVLPLRIRAGEKNYHSDH